MALVVAVVVTAALALVVANAVTVPGVFVAVAPGVVGVVSANESTVVPLCEVVVDVVVDGAWMVVLLAVELVLCDVAALALVLNAADRDVEAARLWLTLADVDAAALAAALNESAML